MLNVVVLTGRLTADPELKTTESGVSLCYFSIAVERRYRSGEDRIADFINITAWRSSAEFVSKYFKKGQMIAIEGSIQTRRYQDKEGKNRTAFEVVANNVQFADFGKRDNNSSADVSVDGEDPLQTFQNSLPDFSQLVDSDDDVPF
ncbi:MAG: single-stranded DNA-binding protein [Clostridia bacterium]|nr:single-stranded DNA-binding protein [Clostridia bacterium]